MPERTDFDYSTPEAREALAGITELILDIETETKRRTLLYERTLGLAVIPALVYRGALLAYRRVRLWRQGVR